MIDFRDSEGAEWRRTHHGTFVRGDGAAVSATVFERDGEWRGVSNIFDTAHFTRRECDTPEAAAELLIEAEAEGENSKLWSSPSTTGWVPIKPKKKNDRPGFWRRRPGAVLTAKQCAPRGGYRPSWYATIMGKSVPDANGLSWFRDAESAMLACDAAYERRSVAGPSAPQQWR